MCVSYYYTVRKQIGADDLLPLFIPLAFSSSWTRTSALLSRRSRCVRIVHVQHQGHIELTGRHLRPFLQTAVGKIPTNDAAETV